MIHTLQTVLSMVLQAFGIAFIGWLLWFSFKRSPERPRLLVKWIVTALTLLYVIKYVVPGFRQADAGTLGSYDTIYSMFKMLIVGVVMFITWRHSIIGLIADPLSSLFDGGTVEVEPKPFYSIALTKRKLSRPLEAIVEIRTQLSKFPNDYEGTLLLATIQAEDMKDVPSAEVTLTHFCEWENAPQPQIAASLTQVADWYIKINNDVDSARTALERIIEKFPDSQYSNAAALRIAHLGGTQKVLLSAQDRRPVAVPAGLTSAGLRQSIREIIPEEADPDKLTEELVKHLEQHPLDAEVRERLAILYARHHHRLDLAAHELVQLAEQPNQPPRKVAHWLNLLTDLQIHGGADFETVRPTLEKIIELFPDLPVAEIARRRLSILKLEIKGQQDGPQGKTLGEYEQNIGLKGDRFFSPRQL
ncbi:MAG TPA: tetratricopeptide repeat protein [Verrucomicrobiae bacterium]|jgi:hypothetical protein